MLSFQPSKSHPAGEIMNRFTSLSSALADMDSPGDLIAGIDIIRSYCALLAQGKSDFVAVEQYRSAVM
jgi:hypothetical protein